MRLKRKLIEADCTPSNPTKRRVTKLTRIRRKFYREYYNTIPKDVREYYRNTLHLSMYEACRLYEDASGMIEQAQANGETVLSAGIVKR